jgi:hypothetical protein
MERIGEAAAAPGFEMTVITTTAEKRRAQALNIVAHRAGGLADFRWWW